MSDLITLPTGVEVPAAVVKTVRILVDGLPPAALDELIAVARDPGHEPFGNTGEILEGFNLLEHGRMHAVTRDIINAMFPGGTQAIERSVAEEAGVPDTEPTKESPDA